MLGSNKGVYHHSQNLKKKIKSVRRKRFSSAVSSLLKRKYFLPRASLFQPSTILIHTPSLSSLVTLTRTELVPNNEKPFVESHPVRELQTDLVQETFFKLAPIINKILTSTHYKLHPRSTFQFHTSRLVRAAEWGPYQLKPLKGSPQSSNVLGQFMRPTDT